MDFTPYIDSFQGSNLDDVLLSVAVQGKVALALKGRFLLRCLCEGFREKHASVVPSPIRPVVFTICSRTATSC